MFVVERIQRPDDTSFSPPDDGSAFWVDCPFGTALFTVSSDWLDVMRGQNRFLEITHLVLGGMLDGTLGDRDLFYATEDQEEFLKSFTDNVAYFCHVSNLSMKGRSKKRSYKGFA